DRVQALGRGVEGVGSELHARGVDRRIDEDAPLEDVALADAREVLRDIDRPRLGEAEGVAEGLQAVAVDDELYVVGRDAGLFEPARKAQAAVERQGDRGAATPGEREVARSEIAELSQAVDICARQVRRRGRRTELRVRDLRIPGH